MQTAQTLRGMIDAAIADNTRAAAECDASASDLERQATEYRETAAGYRREVADLWAMVAPATFSQPPAVAPQPAQAQADKPEHHLPRPGGKWVVYAARFEAAWPRTCDVLREGMAAGKPIPTSDVHALFPGRPVRRRDNELASWLHRHGWHRAGAVIQPYVRGSRQHANWLETIQGGTSK